MQLLTRRTLGSTDDTLIMAQSQVLSATRFILILFQIEEKQK